MTKKSILINKKEVAELLGGISEGQVLRLIRNKKLPCKRLTRGTILFELTAVQKWAETRPALRKTWKQQAEAKRRKLEAENRKQQRKDAEREQFHQELLARQRLTQATEGQREAIRA